MNYLVPNTILVNIFGYNLVNPYPEAIIASQKFALFENLYPQIQITYHLDIQNYICPCLNSLP